MRYYITTLACMLIPQSYMERLGAPKYLQPFSELSQHHREGPFFKHCVLMACTTRNSSSHEMAESRLLTCMLGEELFPMLPKSLPKGAWGS